MTELAKLERDQIHVSVSHMTKDESEPVEIFLEDHALFLSKEESAHLGKLLLRASDNLDHPPKGKGRSLL